MRASSTLRRLLPCVFALVAPASADELGTTRRISDLLGVDGDGASFAASVSVDGRFVAFTSRATNLVPGDVNSKADVFVYEVATGHIELVSVATGGAQGDDDSSEPALSSDGRFVAFTSRATNLVPGDTNAVADIFVRDRLNATTERVSLGVSLVEANARSQGPRISGDGNAVVFTSLASNLVNNDLNGQPDVYLYDRAAQRTARISSGFVAEGTSMNGSISIDGRYVAFQSSSILNLGTDTNGVADVFVRDIVGNALVRLSNSAGLAANGPSEFPAIAGDGSAVAFESSATNLVAGDVNNRRDIFVCSLATGRITLASRSTSGTQGELDSLRPALSQDGHWLAFQSVAAFFDASDQNNLSDVFLVDLHSGATRLVSRSSEGNWADAACLAPSLSGDASFVAFESAASTLVAVDVNGLSDVFLHQPFLSVTTSFCAGDGSALACPCGNLGSTGNGCDNSVATGGARLSASGIASVTADAFLLQGVGMPETSTCLYFQGTATINGGLGAVFGDGLRCLSGTIKRLGVRTNHSGSSGYGAGLGDVPISIRGQIGPTGGVRLYQIWYRDSPPFCAVGTFNLSNGIDVNWSQ